MNLRSISDMQIRLRLLSVRGVSQIVTIGGDIKQYQIIADPVKMKYYDVSLSELKDACTDINQNESDGFINEYGKEYIINAVMQTSDTIKLEILLLKLLMLKMY